MPSDAHPSQPKIIDLSDQPPSKVLPDPTTIPDLVDFDTETSKLHPDDDGAIVSVISLAWRGADGVIHAGAWPFGQGRDDRPKHEDNPVDIGPREYSFLVDWLSRAGGGLSGHNVVFDMQMLALQSRGAGYKRVDLSRRMRWDTMVVAQEIWPRAKSHSLKGLAVELLGDDADAEQQALQPHLGPKTDARYDRVPWEVMHPYALNDAIYTNQLRWIQARQIAEGEVSAGHLHVQMSLTRAILDMQLMGVPYDPEYSRLLGDQLKAEIDKLVGTLPFRPTGPAAVKWFFQDPEGPGLKPYAMTDSGQPSLTTDIVDRMVADGVPHAGTWQTIARYKSALSKWYYPFADRCGPDNRIRSSLRQGHVKSGRLSASRINLQAIPNDYKIHLPVITPRQVILKAIAEQHPGWQLWDLDLEQAELRIASMYAQCDPMLEMVREGRDAHGETATALFQVEPGHPEFKTYRQVAKRANFSLIFGSGPATFQEMVRREAGVELSIKEATQTVYSWRDLYPEFDRAIRANQTLVDELGYVPLPNGRRRWYQKHEDSHSAFNQLVQTMQAEFTKEWLIYTNRRLRPYRARGGGLLLMVHDSLVTLLPVAEAAELTEDIRSTGVRMWSEFFPGVPGGIDVHTWDA